MLKIKNVHGNTLDALGSAIVAGKYAQGSVVPPEAILCAEFGVSRTVVREVVKSLVAKGLVTTGPKAGTKVTSMSNWNLFDPDVIAWQIQCGLTRDQLREVQDLRRILEPAAVRLAALHATPEDLAYVQAAFEGMTDAVENGGDYITHDVRFHQGLLHACHNRLIWQMSKALTGLLRTTYEVATARPAGPAERMPLHRAVMDAVVAGDPDKAEAAALTLMDVSRQDVEDVLGSRRKLPPSSKRPMLLKPPSAAKKKLAVKKVKS